MSLAEMTGQQLQLQQTWQTRGGWPQPALVGITIESPSGLRGIRDIDVRFEYPLTAVAGRNGSGKSTLLGLAALAFHSPSGHFAPGAVVQRGADRSYYTFRDFFVRGPGDADHIGTQVCWYYRGSHRDGDLLGVKRGNKQWMRYQRRPIRTVYYVPMSRCVPASERSVLRSYFGTTAATKYASTSVTLDRQYTRHLGRILDRDYATAENLELFGHSIRRCRSNSSYTSFNMGAGEDVLIELLALLQEAEPGSLVVIEEIELGLHPSALTRLARIMDRVCREKCIQIICSTHSDAFLDAVPPVARVLLQRSATGHSVHCGPSTQVCVTDLTGERHAELVVLCEDQTAARLIEKALPLALKRRVNVVTAGGDSDLATGAVSLVSGASSRVLILWDGDVEAKDPAAIWLSPALDRHGLGTDRVGFDFLPGGKPPEAWLLEVITSDDGVRQLAIEVQSSEADTAQLLSEATVGTAKGTLGRLANILGVEFDDVVAYIVAALAKMPSDPLSPIREAVQMALDGVVVRPSRGGTVSEVA